MSNLIAITDEEMADISDTVHNKAYQQGRADAIDEVLALIEEHSKLNYTDFKDEVLSETEYSYRDDECLALVEKIEQLKGKTRNNEVR